MGNDKEKIPSSKEHPEQCGQQQQHQGAPGPAQVQGSLLGSGQVTQAAGKGFPVETEGRSKAVIWEHHEAFA